MAATFTIHDLFLWLGLVGSMAGLVVTYSRARKSQVAEHKAEIVDITKWRVNIERDIRDVNIEQGHSRAHSDSVISKLNDVSGTLDDLKSRAVRIETILDERSEGAPF